MGSRSKKSDRDLMIPPEEVLRFARKWNKRWAKTEREYI